MGTKCLFPSAVNVSEPAEIFDEKYCNFHISVHFDLSPNLVVSRARTRSFRGSYFQGSRLSKKKSDLLPTATIICQNGNEWAVHCQDYLGTNHVRSPSKHFEEFEGENCPSTRKFRTSQNFSHVSSGTDTTRVKQNGYVSQSEWSIHAISRVLRLEQISEPLQQQGLLLALSRCT